MRWSGLSLLAVTLLLLAAGAGLAFLFGLFQELVDSTHGSNFFEEVSTASPTDSIQKFANRAFLSIAFLLGVLIIAFVFARGRRGHWMGALLLVVLLLIIGTPLANTLNLVKAVPPELSGSGTGSFMENGLNIQLDMGGTIPSLDNMGVPQVDPSSAPSPSLSPEGGHQLLNTPVFRVSGAGDIRFLRTMASTTYNGEVWTIDDGLKFSALEDTTFPSQVVGFDRVVEDSVTLTPITSFGTGFIPTALNMSGIRFPAPLRWNPELFTFQSTEVIEGSYGFDVSSYTFDESVLRGLSITPDSRYLQLPDNISNRVRGLALEVTAEASSQYEKAKALEYFLKTKYTYDFDFKNAPQGWEASDWFLFEDQRGVCANFNHAFVIMARSLGLTARPVVGWAVASTDLEQEVSAGQAHQWAEVLFQGAGWLSFDATAPGGAPDRVQAPTPAPTPTPTPSPTPTPVPPTATPAPTPAPTSVPPNKGDFLENGLEADLNGGGAVSGLSLSPEGAHQLSDVPVFLVRGARDTRYLRVMVSNTYDGSMWQGGFTGEAIPYQGTGGTITPASIDESYLTQAGSTVITAIPLTSFTPGFLPTSKYTIAGDFPAPVARYGQELLFQSATEFNEPYSWEAVTPILSQAELASASVVEDPTYLQLPNNITDRVKALAREITQGLDSPYAKAKELERVLKTEYVYDLDYRNAPDEWEAADWFLFEDQRGVCSNFNHAFVIMARSLGLPARPVAGWAVTPTEQEQVVSTKQAHQWAEVLFQGIGWVRFDATAPGGPQDRVPEDPGPDPTVVPTLGPTSEPPSTPIPTPGPTSGPTPGPGPTPTLIETFTEITSVESFATKGGEFIVKGTVVDNVGNPLHETPIDIYINETKEHGGILLGSGETSNGVFQISVQVPTDIPVGNYQVLAHAMPAGGYMDSWSDPPIVILTETATTLGSPDTVVVGTIAAFGGSLTEEFGEPMAGHMIDLLIDNRLAATTLTSLDGTFSLQHRFTDTGPATVTVQFPGTDLYLSSQAEHALRVVMETSITVSAPQSAYMEQPVLFSGRLVDMFGAPIAGEEVLLSSAGQGEIGRATTDGGGTFSLEHAFDRGGALTILARFAGTELYLPSSAETSIDVFITTRLTIVPPSETDPPPCPVVSSPNEATRLEGEDVRLDSAIPITCVFAQLTKVNMEQPVVFSGRLTDTFGQPLRGQFIHLLVNFEAVDVGTTDGDGYYQISHTFQSTRSLIVSASFPGNGLYLPAQVRITVDVMMPTAILLELPEYGPVHHTTTLTGVLQDF